MAIAIESTSAAGFVTGAVTITNPSGLTAGDYMLLVLGANTSSMVAQSGWTEIYNITDEGTSSKFTEIGAWWKQATAGDVAAGSVTSTSSAGSAYAGTLIRISSSTTPVFRLAGSGTDAFSASGLSHYVNGSPVLLVMSLSQTIGGGNNGSFSAYTVTTGGSNPTWTESIDVHRTISDEATFATAYATQTLLDSTITAFGATFTGDSNAKACALISIQEPSNLTGTNALLTTTPVFFGESSVEVGTVGTSDLFISTPEIFSASGKGTSAPTSWTDQEKGTATWTDQIKNI